MVNKLADQMSVFSQALNLRAYRQQALAANIANADTPQYKARDIDFSAALKVAMSGRGSGDLALSRTAPAHLTGGTGAGPAPLLYRTETQSSVDGNTVDMDVERAAFADNAIHYEALTRFITEQLKGMSAALSS